MDSWSLTMFSALVRTAGVQLVASAVLALLMRHRWQNRPRTCRLACFLVLLQGWMLVPLTVAIPWYDPQPECALRTPLGRTTADVWIDGSTQASWRSASGQMAPAAGTLAIGDTSGVAPWRAQLHNWLPVAARVAVCVWGAGVLALGAALWFRYRRFRLALATAPAARSDWLAEWKVLLQQQGIRRELPLLLTRNEGPMFCRLAGKPTVLVPEGLWRHLSPLSRQLILRHELGHYLRGDVWKSLLARVLALPQWFHPAARWAVRMFDQCGERLCDELAVSNPVERIAYARALAQLAAQRLPVPAVGSCAHSHPLVSRVRCLLASPNKENGMMRSALLLAVTAALFVAGAVRVELIAKDVVHTKDSARAKIEELDRTLEKLAVKVHASKAKAAALKVQVEARIAEAEQAHESGRFSNETQQRLTVLQSGGEAQQLAIVEEANARDDEGLVLLGVAAGHSIHQAVRRKAMQAALEVGVTAAPVLVYAFEYLPDADQIFLAEQLAKYLTPECIIGLGAIVERAGPQVQDAVIRLAAASDQRLLLFGVMGQGVKNNSAIVDKLLSHAARFPADDGLAALYALAKLGSADQKIVAVKAAVSRGQEGLPVLAAAYKCQEPKVRAAVISAAKAIGGELADWGIQMALQDPDAGLREAAQKALEAAPAGN
jgi:beta-lactamase regulating signal transducer with metallopeptidase domain